MGQSPHSGFGLGVHFNLEDEEFSDVRLHDYEENEALAEVLGITTDNYFERRAALQAAGFSFERAGCEGFEQLILVLTATLRTCEWGPEVTTLPTQPPPSTIHHLIEVARQLGHPDPTPDWLVWSRYA